MTNGRSSVDSQSRVVGLCAAAQAAECRSEDAVGQSGRRVGTARKDMSWGYGRDLREGADVGKRVQPQKHERDLVEQFPSGPSHMRRRSLGRTSDVYHNH